ncbi:hypothetical protein PLESTB_000411700 [Pleodorina starrii]|uniref:Uncharacterized protein n=1 Tax=Pleodorina starrii TaxID=330485 RepID=A0A9W6BEL1_9CHLO|nr:hypothetical protein PLESTB_000411700 [Pleodorina starrii]GLC70278.1 hypothetical protein PLESTF_000954500 [Pleodorina starrii]
MERMEMQAIGEGFREMTGRELLLSLSRFGALVAGRMGLREDEFDREEEEDEEDQETDLNDDLPEAMEEDRELDLGPAIVASSPASCSFLFPGRTFTGSQRLSSPHRQQEDWAVTATIYSCDFECGRVTGSMVAQNSPLAKRPIVTYFEGDIIDNVNHTFWTGRKWGSPSQETDVRYWSRCLGFSGSLRAAVQRHSGRAPELGSCQYLFMRWKECFFVDVPQDCPLTITGFYYLSLDRLTGSIGGYYHDSRAAPLQVLQLRPIELDGGGASTCASDSARGLVRAGSEAAAAGSSSTGAAGTGPEATGGEDPAGMAFGSYTLC